MMAGNERFDDLVSSWLQERAPEGLPTRVLETTFERTRRATQQLGWREVLGRHRARRFVPALGTAAAIALATILALNVGIFAGPGSTPTPAPTATQKAAPPPTASPAGLLPTAGPGELPADWIAYRSGPDILAVDARNPTHTTLIRASLGLDPIAWSSDASKLLVGSHPDVVPEWADGGWGISVSTSGLAVLNADGSTNSIGGGSAVSHRPWWGSFSPDGTKVAFACCGGNPAPSIADVDGQNERSVLKDCGAGCGEPIDESAAWSPVSSEIAWLDFWEDHPAYGHHARVLSFVRADGTGLRESVVQLPGEAGGLTWSPDGLRLAFWGIPLGVNGAEQLPAQIYVVNADGSGLHPLTVAGDNRWPTWSPDGTRIAFARGEVSLLTGDDGSQIEYIEPGSRELITMAADGTDIVLFEGIHPEGPIAWAPGGAR